MSLLINESYANPSKPLWVSASGNGVVSGNLTVDGKLTVENNLANIKYDTQTSLTAPNATANQNVGQLDLQTESVVSGGFAAHLRMGIDGSTGLYGTGFIQALIPSTPLQNAPLVLQPGGGDVGIGVLVPTEALDVLGNIQCTGTVSASIVNAGTVICPPFQCIPSPITIGSVGLSPSPFTPTNPFSVVTNGEYDVCFRIQVGATGVPPTAGDKLICYLSCASVPTYADKFSWQYVFNGEDPVTTYIQVRDRIFADSNTTMTLEIGRVVTNPATTYVAVLEQWDVTRVA